MLPPYCSRSVLSSGARGRYSGEEVTGAGHPARAVLGAGALYWYAPEITPDQIWASRRFVPAVLPALAVWATVALAVCASVRRVRRLPRTMQHAVAGAAAIVLIVPPAVVTSPVMWERSQAGYLQPILASCDAVGPDAAVIVVGGWAGATLPQSLRSWCDVPVAAAGTGLGPDKVAQVAAQVRDNGYRLVLLAADAASLKGYQVDGRPSIRLNCRCGQSLDAGSDTGSTPVEVRGAG